MDIIGLTRELGKKLQEEECYIKMRTAQQTCDEDQGLQQAIGEFNTRRAGRGRRQGKGGGQ